MRTLTGLGIGLLAFTAVAQSNSAAVTNVAVYRAFAKIEKAQAATYKVNLKLDAEPAKPAPADANYVIGRLHRLYSLVKPRFTVKVGPAAKVPKFGPGLNATARKQLTELVRVGAIPSTDRLLKVPKTLTADQVGELLARIVQRTSELAPERLDDETMGRETKR